MHSRAYKKYCISCAICASTHLHGCSWTHHLPFSMSWKVSKEFIIMKREVSDGVCDKEKKILSLTPTSKMNTTTWNNKKYSHRFLFTMIITQFHLCQLTINFIWGVDDSIGSMCVLEQVTAILFTVQGSFWSAILNDQCTSAVPGGGGDTSGKYPI